jgi:hypothetical protein
MGGSLPGQREETADVGLEAVELALYHHALFGAVAKPFFYHHMHVDAGNLTVRARDMEFSGRLGKMFLDIRAFHTLFSNTIGWNIKNRNRSLPPQSVGE